MTNALSGLVLFITGAVKCNYVCVVVAAPLQRHPTVPIFAAGSGFESRKSRRNGPWLLSSCGHSRRTPNYATLPVQFPRLSLCLSRSVHTAACGVEATVLARLHHVALPLWAVSCRLRSCAAAVEAAVVAAFVAAGGAAVAVADEVLRAAVVGAAAVSIALPQKPSQYPRSNKPSC